MATGSYFTVKGNSKYGLADKSNRLLMKIENQYSWLTGLFAAAGLAPESDLARVHVRMDELANQAAPVTRRSWKWILFLQALVVLLPLMWLLRRQAHIPIGTVAAATFTSVVLLVAVSWWLRWRGMQKTWARARLVAEVARSLLATASCPDIHGLNVWDLAPALVPLQKAHRPPPRDASFSEWRDHYIKERIEDQDGYFASKQTQAEKERKQLSRWTTLLLDIALAFAFAGLAIAGIPQLWLKELGDVRVELMLGLAGVAIPVGLLLVQILRGVQELSRRTARYAQQRQMLQQAKARLLTAQIPAAAVEVINNTEQLLLGEVLEWYFQAETAEHFFQVGKKETQVRRLKTTEPISRPWKQLTLTVVAKIGSAGLFILRVILGRLPWIVASAAAILMWLAYGLGHVTEDPKRAELQNKVVIDWRPWSLAPERATHGCVILVHGLYGSVSPDDEMKAWMKNCAEAIAKKRGPDAPNIGCVDWSVSSTPSKSILSSRLRLTDWVIDISAIRPDARAVGDVLFEKLKGLIEARKILKEKPLHLVGHSAGGFVVAEAAINLVKAGLAPSQIHVTILDTPGVDHEILVDLPQRCCTDFYRSSPVGGVATDSIVNMAQTLFQAGTALVSKDFSARQMHFHALSLGNGLNFLHDPAYFVHVQNWKQVADKIVAAHQGAYKWFEQTISDPDAPDCVKEGFNRSPILNPSLQCDDQ
jgi:pimeloyl-ACP methyl ester carboxylesterase